MGRDEAEATLTLILLKVQKDAQEVLLASIKAHKGDMILPPRRQARGFLSAKKIRGRICTRSQRSRKTTRHAQKSVLLCVLEETKVKPPPPSRGQTGVCRVKEEEDSTHETKKQ
ncbi:hypothetical protein Tcan_16258 [Toxocara canis]|uniref:Uncharacterized protein n=1 Tax=Toxocara canis TaxID=6265 RepID=A0A0B2V0T7_TOXCA|nr:hypothetical protein Tcan_16258 [Toxocara canis]